MRHAFVEFDETVFEGQVLTHCPLDASLPLAQVKQNVEDSVHVEQDESQAVHVTLSFEMKEPEGQLETQAPLERNEPGRQPVHCNWLTVEAVVKFGILQDVHLAPQAEVDDQYRDSQYTRGKVTHCRTPSCCCRLLDQFPYKHHLNLRRRNFR